MSNPKIYDISTLSYVTIPLEMHLEETGTKLASGTGFIYEFEDKPYLITNWHNVTGLNPITREPLSSHGGRPNLIKFSLLSKNASLRWEGFSTTLYEENKAEWLVHPVYGEKVDVIALELEPPENFTGVFRPINHVHFDDFKLQVADEVFVLGYPYELTGGGNFPIWKKGSVATEPDIDYDNLPKMFIDTASKQGMSGSPVIYRRFGIHTKDGNINIDTLIGTVRGFVGIYSGRVIGNSDLDAQLGIVWKAHVIEEILKGGVRDTLTF